MTDTGYVVGSANDSATAAAIVQKEMPPLVISDITMPGKNGLELLQEFKENGFQTAVVVLTAHVESPIVIKALRLGALDYINKPFSHEEIKSKVSGWIEIGRRLQEVARESTKGTDHISHQLRMIELFRLRNHKATTENK